VRAACRQVEPIVEAVRARGDEAVREYTSRFDKVDLDDVCIPLEVRPGHARLALRHSCGCGQVSQEAHPDVEKPV
jgi:histidinol dehydrogenase